MKQNRTAFSQKGVSKASRHLLNTETRLTKTQELASICYSENTMRPGKLPDIPSNTHCPKEFRDIKQLSHS